MELLKPIGLASRRMAAGYTQQTFADALGIQRPRLTMWEIGYSCPTADWLPWIAELLGCTIDELYIPLDKTIIPQEAQDAHAGDLHESVL